jgi:hypothetical protein
MDKPVARHITVHEHVSFPVKDLRACSLASTRGQTERNPLILKEYIAWTTVMAQQTSPEHQARPAAGCSNRHLPLHAPPGENRFDQHAPPDRLFQIFKKI